METTNKYVVNYGRLCWDPNEEMLETMIVSSYEEVKNLALLFITVIQDDTAKFEDNIANWDGISRLIINHLPQCADDTFYFSAALIKDNTDKDSAKFSKFVNTWMV